MQQRRKTIFLSKQGLYLLYHCLHVVNKNNCIVEFHSQLNVVSSCKKTGLEILDWVDKIIFVILKKLRMIFMHKKKVKTVFWLASNTAEKGRLIIINFCHLNLTGQYVSELVSFTYHL